MFTHYTLTLKSETIFLKLWFSILKGKSQKIPIIYSLTMFTYKIVEEKQLTITTNTPWSMDDKILTHSLTLPQFIKKKITFSNSVAILFKYILYCLTNANNQPYKNFCTWSIFPPDSVEGGKKNWATPKWVANVGDWATGKWANNLIHEMESEILLVISVQVPQNARQIVSSIWIVHNP